MAINFSKPATADTYTNFVVGIRDNHAALAQMLDSSHTTITGTPPTYAKRYNRTSSAVEEYSGSSWAPIKFHGLTYTSGIVSIGTTPGDEATRLQVDGRTSLTNALTINAVDANARVRLNSSSVGSSTFGQSNGGLELVAGSMNTTSQYTPGVKFGSSDTEFTTTNPKFGAAIVGKARQTYSTDDSGSMALSFWASPTNPGASGGMVETMVLDGNGQALSTLLLDAATPNWSFTNDPDTGMFRSGTNGLAFSTAGVSRLQVGATGTVTALFDLTVTGAFTGTNGTFSSNSLPQLTINRPGSTVNAHAGYTTTAGTVYAGQGAANTFAVGGTSNLSSAPWLTVTSSAAAFATSLRALSFDSAAATDLLLRPAGTLRATLTVAGLLQLPAGNVNGGLQLPNAANSSANVLDWYEELSWTPTALGQTTPGTPAYVTQIGRGLRFGRLVIAYVEVAWTTHTGTGNLRIGGFPYAFARASRELTARSQSGTGLAFDSWVAQSTVAGSDVTLLGNNQNTGANATRAVAANDSWVLVGIYEV